MVPVELAYTSIQGDSGDPRGGLADEPGAKAHFSSLVHLDLKSLLHSPGESLDILALGHRSNDKLINSTQSVYAHLIGNPS